MSDIKANTPIPLSDSTTITIIVSNLTPPDFRAVPSYSVCSYTVPEESARPCVPLSDGAVRVGNSLLSAYVSENAILRDFDGDI